MNDETSKPADKPAISGRLQAACDVAAGRVQPDDAASGTSIIGAKKDLNARSNGPQWYRMVYRNRAWQYVTADRLPSGNFLAADRRAEVSGRVYPGEIVVQHDRGSPVNRAWLVTEALAGKCLNLISFSVRRDGRMTFVLPDGGEVVTDDPRTKS